MKTNSELPKCLLKENNDLNDFDFVLVHLFLEDASYRKFFLKQRKKYPERLMILDNSGYEMLVKNKNIDMSDYINIINTLMPDYYILPDYLMDLKKTVQGVKDFLKKISEDERYNALTKKPKPMGVLQGNSYEDFEKMIELYYKLKIKAVAIPFHNSFYKTVEPDDDIYWEFAEEFGFENEDANYARGRVQFLRDHKDILKRLFKHIHILGSHQPFEKKWYKDYNTMDTGYPVKLGVLNIKMGEDIKKPDIIIDDFFTSKMSETEKTLIRDNIIMFKNY